MLVKGTCNECRLYSDFDPNGRLSAAGVCMGCTAKYYDALRQAYGAIKEADLRPVIDEARILPTVARFRVFKSPQLNDRFEQDALILLPMLENERQREREIARAKEYVDVAKQLLDKKDIKGADEYVLEKRHEYPALLAEYEKLKREIIATDLRDVETNVGERFDREKLDVLAATGKHILVRARAGSGKTTAVALKVRQLMTLYGAKPEEILVLAFNQDAAKEFSSRINRYVGHTAAKERENASTFHSFAYRIVNPGEQLLFNDKQRHAEYVKGQQTAFIGQCLEELQAEDRGMFLTLIYNLFRFAGKDKFEGDFVNIADYYTWRRNLEYVTLGGDRVKSKAEKYIADFLFEHELRKGSDKVTYKYEWNMRLPGFKRSYKPDFSLFTDTSGIRSPQCVIEYFGVTERHPADPGYMDAETEARYMRDKGEKRKVCQQNGIGFVEFSADDFDDLRDDDRAGFEEKLRQRLTWYGFDVRKLDIETIYKRMLDAKDNQKRLWDQLAGFIARAKKLSLTPEGVRAAAVEKQDSLNERSRSFLKIAIRVYERYQQRLKAGGSIDFDDLVQAAATKIRTTNGLCAIEVFGKLQAIRNIRYILIDEYQDFSKLFYDLIEAVISTNRDVSIFCVGDDWQAINGFAGSDLEFFEQFGGKYFSDGREVSLLTNHRSCSKIVEHGNAIMAGHGEGGKPAEGKIGGEVHMRRLEYVEYRNELNRNQMFTDDAKYREAAKDLYGSENGSTSHMEMARCLKTLSMIAQENSGKEIKLLFRSNKLYGAEITKITEKIRALTKENIICSTAHRSKGTQSDVVIIADANRGKYPTLHPDNELLELLGVTIDKVIDEERRLFYVAATRAKSKLYLVHEDDALSDFVPGNWKYEYRGHASATETNFTDMLTGF